MLHIEYPDKQVREVSLAGMLIIPKAGGREGGPPLVIGFPVKAKLAMGRIDGPEEMSECILF